MSAYKLTNESWVIRASDNARIPTTDSPDDPNINPEYLEYKWWLEEGGIPDPSDHPSPEHMRELIAARRYDAEVAGITINGLQINTDDRSKLLINGAALEATIDADYVMQWKTQDGFVELSGAQVIGIARAVRAHVQACFDREAVLLDMLSAGTLTPEAVEQFWQVD